MAPAGVFWAVARARVAFCCARGKGGEAMVLLGAKEGGKELEQGRNVGGGQSAAGGELRRARGRFWPFKANPGRKGRRFGGRWRAALMAGRGQRLGRARPARLGATAARRRVAVRLSRRARQRAGRQRRAGRAHSREGRESAARPGGSAAAARQRGRGSGAARQRAHARSSACARAQSREGRVSGEEREGREKESGERKKKSAV